MFIGSKKGRRFYHWEKNPHFLTMSNGRIAYNVSFSFESNDTIRKPMTLFERKL